MFEKELIKAAIAEIQEFPDDALAALERAMILPEIIASKDFLGNSTRQKEQGIFYTNFHLARILVEEVLNASQQKNGTFLEPCVGGGAFYFAFIEASMKRSSGSPDDLNEILHRCYIADNDQYAIDTLTQIAPSFFNSRYGSKQFIPKSNVFVGDSTWSAEGQELQDFKKIFNLPEGFDYIVTNPPYKLLKNDKRQGTKLGSDLLQIFADMKKSKELKYLQGVPNLYKVFVELISSKWISNRGTIGLLIPRSLLSDSQSSTLREYILDNFELKSIFDIPEGNDHFKGVGQAFSMFAASKGRRTEEINFAQIPNSGDLNVVRGKPILLSKVRQYTKNSAIHNISDNYQKLLEHLSNFESIGTFQNLVNLRGEFDMTLDSAFTAEENTTLELIQGSNLGKYKLVPSQKFVVKEFIERPKGRWINTQRIACQQISNRNQQDRMKWALIPPGKILANSCNFVAIENEGLWTLPQDTIFYLLAILNSKMMNIRFKLLSPNNHISNYEIDSLPVGNLEAPEIPTIIQLSKELNCAFEPSKYLELDSIISKHFGLTTYWKQIEENL
jgi:Alw26I/Eco31I/Esp3I family type II restriction m6 adenine DNA methyltransferase